MSNIIVLGNVLYNCTVYCTLVYLVYYSVQCTAASHGQKCPKRDRKTLFGCYFFRKSFDKIHFINAVNLVNFIFIYFPVPRIKQKYDNAEFFLIWQISLWDLAGNHRWHLATVFANRHLSCLGTILAVGQCTRQWISLLHIFQWLLCISDSD